MTATVTRAEANLLTLARTAVGLVPAGDVLRLLATSVPPPTKLGPTAQRVLAETLSRGAVLVLARQGGWQVEAGGRLWERHARPPQLVFTGNIVRLLQWVLKTPLADQDLPPLGTHGPLTLGESLIAASLLDRLRGTGCEGALARQHALRTAPLVVLANVVELARVGPLEAPSFDAAALGLTIEGIGGLLTRSWVSGELAKREVAEPEVLSRIGAAQEQVLDAFLAAIDKAQARQLANFLVDAAAEWLRTPRTPEDLVRGLSTEAPLRARTEARRRAGAFMRALARLRTWDAEHRGTRFIDDGYDLAQALVARWERLGDAGFNAAARLVEALEALPQ
jgi:hypothetical protein